MSVTKITDANALYEIARLYTSAFPAYNSEMKRVLQVKKIVEQSDNADTLQKETPAQIIKQAKDAIEAHRKNLQNPHNETVESIGTLTGDYFKSLVVNKMPTGVLPISAFGYDYKSWADKSIVGWFTVVGENLVVGPNVTVMMNGSEFPIPAGTYDLREVHATWRTVPIFIYFRQVEGVPVLDLLAMNQKDTRTLMLGGVIRAGNTTPEMQRTIKVGSYRLSSTPVGQATAVGLNAFNSTYGIHRGWVPSSNVLQPDIPPKVEIKLLDYDRGNGDNGYITSSQGGELLLQANVGVDPNIYFALDGESVTVTATVEVLSGAAPVVTKVSNTQFRVRCATYSNSRITFTASIPTGDTATYTLRTEHRTNLSIRYNTSDFAIGSYGGLTKLTTMINVSRWFDVALTGDGVVTSVTSGAITGGSYTLRRVDNTTFDVIGSVDAMGLVTVTATDKYGRTANLQLYVEVRTAYPPEIFNTYVRRGSGKVGGKKCGGSTTCCNYNPGPSSGVVSYGIPGSIQRRGCTTVDWLFFDLNPGCTVSYSISWPTNNGSVLAYGSGLSRYVSFQCGHGCFMTAAYGTIYITVRNEIGESNVYPVTVMAQY